MSFVQKCSECHASFAYDVNNNKTARMAGLLLTNSIGRGVSKALSQDHLKREDQDQLGTQFKVQIPAPTSKIGFPVEQGASLRDI